VPSQRLLKILDPGGHLGDGRVMASTAPKALLWASPTARGWMGRALSAAGFTPLVASALRHVRASMHPIARPAITLVVAELVGADDDTMETLTAGRWAGYPGAIWLVTSAPPAPRVLHVLDARIVAPTETALVSASTATRR
jgi:hypothetical protein